MFIKKSQDVIELYKKNRLWAMPFFILVDYFIFRLFLKRKSMVMTPGWKTTLAGEECGFKGPFREVRWSEARQEKYFQDAEIKVLEEDIYPLA